MSDYRNSKNDRLGDAVIIVVIVGCILLYAITRIMP